MSFYYLEQLTPELAENVENCELRYNELKEWFYKQQGNSMPDIIREAIRDEKDRAHLELAEARMALTQHLVDITKAKINEIERVINGLNRENYAVIALEQDLVVMQHELHCLLQDLQNDRDRVLNLSPDIPF